MAGFNVLTDLSSFPLTRADLQSMWTTAAITTVVKADLASDFLSIDQVTTYSDLPSSPEPGKLAWVFDEQLTFCYHDEVDGTGVSLWLAIGPDVFETACLLAEPAFPGTLVEPWFDRWVKNSHHTDSILGDGVAHKMIGTVHSGVPFPLNTRTPDTNASGTWVRVAIDGMVFGWVPNASGVSEGLYAIQEGSGIAAAPDDAAHPDNGGYGGIIKATAAGGRHGTVPPYQGFCGISLYSSFNNTTSTDWGQHVRFRFTGYQDQKDRTP